MDHLRQLHTVVSIGTLLLNVVESEESTVRKQTSWQLSIGLATDLDGDTGMEKNPKTPLLTKPCVRMNKAADVCVNLKTGDRKTFPRVSSCYSVEFYGFSPECNS